MIECDHLNVCASAKDKNKCKKCACNTMRNYVEDFFVEAKDNPIPEYCPKLTYSGPAEQTAGYECPVCGGFSNPYALHGKSLCLHCGYKLNTGR